MKYYDLKQMSEEQREKDCEQSPEPMCKMPSYVGCKIILAYPMNHKEFIEKIKKEVFGKEDEEGYFVVYPDGYKSWSPKKTFENAYRRITVEEEKLLR